jgi:hypothetical protein
VSWEREFVTLAKTHSVEEVERVLSWFEANAAERWTPHVYDARMFRRKFVQIRDATKQRPSMDVEISDRARRVCVALGDLVWPSEETKDQELAAVQVSLDNYEEWLARLRRVAGRPGCGLVEYLLAVGGDAELFVVEWFLGVHRLSRSWDKWNGNLESWTTTTERIHFRRTINFWCCEYLGPGDHWDKLQEMLR